MEGTNQAQEVRAAQIRLLYEQAPPALIATTINAAIVVLVFWRLIPKSLLIGWFLVSLLVVLARFALRRCYLLNNPTAAESPRWGRYFIAGVAINGVLWGFAGFFFFLENHYVHQLFLAFVLAGMASGSIATLSPVSNAYLIFLVPALLPYTARLVSVGSEVHLAMGGMLLLYIVMMTIISRRQHVTVAESLRLRFENLDLLDDLKRTQDRQERVNQELAAQVAEKRRAQDLLQKAYAELEQRVRERTEMLARSEEALRNASRRKDEFLAMLGHELRNPLAPIRNAVQIMRRPELSESLLTWARDIIDRQVDHLARLVDDLLDVSRIVQGKISLHTIPLDLATVVEHALEASGPLIAARHHKLSVSLPEQPLQVTGDLVRLAQVISNLLNNAAKYTDAGGRIQLETQACDHWVSIRVRDNGMGISAVLLPHVFDLFTQADQSLARTQGGLGIGLTLVKRLVEMHGGHVEAHSQGPGQGSEFVVRLPREGISRNGTSAGFDDGIRRAEC